MPQLIPVAYHHRHYPPGIYPKIRELAGHFDITSISPDGPYSLHSEYSYGPRKLTSSLIAALPVLRNANRKGVPQLWRSEEWAEAFCDFIVALVDGHPLPTVVEIHPPFDDYCPSIGDFLDRYAVFEQRLRGHFPEAQVLLENRSGSVYRGGRFLISDGDALLELCQMASGQGLDLGIALDVPQLLTTLGGPKRLSADQVAEAILQLKPCRDRIKGLHLWGKKKSPKGRTVSHAGTLDTYFEGEAAKKQALLEGLWDLLDDGTPRLFVPEVNSSDTDLAAIVADLADNGFGFQ